MASPRMKVLWETVGVFAENTYFLFEPQSLEAVVVDPGDEAGRLLGVIREHRLQVRYILNTHGHLDHVGAVAEVQRATGAPFHIHPADSFFLDALGEQAALFGLPAPPAPAVDGELAAGQVFEFGRPPLRLEVLETPGHSPGSVSFAVGGVLVAGDALFAGSIGRTDLPGGDLDTLLASIRTRLLVFPDETPVYPGHGPPTTVGQERRTNPFLTGHAGGF